MLQTTDFSYHALWRSLTPLYDAGEARAITRLVLEEFFGMTLADIAAGATAELPAAGRARLAEAWRQLADATPVQYVTGVEWFCGRRYAVEPGVLIPRPETELLCRWVAAEVAPGSRILDIGTGSGCIACTAALDIAGADVHAWDISPVALRVAAANAAALRAAVTVVRQDALRPPCDVAAWDAIVSNPPYVMQREKAVMHRNVLAHEPALALFVPDSDPLLFYTAAARYASKALKEGGRLFFEINPLCADATAAMLRSEGFGSVELRRDDFGKLRMIKAER